MEAVLIYLLKVNVALAALYILYKLAFDKDTFLSLKRFILISICILSVLYPFIEIEITGNNNNLNVLSILLPEVVVDNPAETTTAGFHWIYIIAAIYAFGILLIASRTFLELRKIRKNILTGEKSIINGTPVHILKEKAEPFSFLKWICIHPHSYNKDELEEILLHEHTHAREYHSLDVLLIQTIIIFNWFNPFAWLLRNEIKINHEYLADRKVINAGFCKKSYQYHLIGFTHKQTFSSVLFNSFSVLPLKNRLKMLNRRATPGFMVYKYLLLVPVFLFLLFFANCQNNDIATGIDLAKTSTPEENVVFEIVEKMPEYPGGQTALMSYLNKNIRYPEKAQANGVQGRVIVQFIVGRDGSITDAVIVRSVEEELDKEAIRIISTMPKWIPGSQRGRPVRVKYTVPIAFRLD